MLGLERLDSSLDRFGVEIHDELGLSGVTMIIVADKSRVKEGGDGERLRR
jgi:hypothetical protein